MDVNDDGWNGWNGWRKTSSLGEASQADFWSGHLRNTTTSCSDVYLRDYLAERDIGSSEFLKGILRPCPHVHGYFLKTKPFFFFWPFVHTQTQKLSVQETGGVWASSLCLMSSFLVWCLFMQLYLLKQQWINSRNNQNSAI